MRQPENVFKRMMWKHNFSQYAQLVGTRSVLQERMAKAATRLAESMESGDQSEDDEAMKTIAQTLPLLSTIESIIEKQDFGDT